MVEREGFLNLINYLKPGYKVPNRKSIASIIHWKHEIAKYKLKDKLEKEANLITLAIFGQAPPLKCTILFQLIIFQLSVGWSRVFWNSRHARKAYWRENSWQISGNHGKVGNQLKKILLFFTIGRQTSANSITVQLRYRATFTCTFLMHLRCNQTVTIRSVQGKQYLALSHQSKISRYVPFTTHPEHIWNTIEIHPRYDWDVLYLGHTVQLRSKVTFARVLNAY